MHLAAAETRNHLELSITCGALIAGALPHFKRSESSCRKTPPFIFFIISNAKRRCGLQGSRSSIPPPSGASRVIFFGGVVVAARSRNGR